MLLMFSFVMNTWTSDYAVKDKSKWWIGTDPNKRRATVGRAAYQCFCEARDNGEQWEELAQRALDL